jgi:hypothetical protein
METYIPSFAVQIQCPRMVDQGIIWDKFGLLLEIMPMGGSLIPTPIPVWHATLPIMPNKIILLPLWEVSSILP